LQQQLEQRPVSERFGLGRARRAVLGCRFHFLARAVKAQQRESADVRDRALEVEQGLGLALDPLAACLVESRRRAAPAR
jgi:hypothetical protein